MNFDPPLAKAELDRAVILISHHLRHIESLADLEMAKEFNRQIQRLERRAEQVYIKTKRKTFTNKAVL